MAYDREDDDPAAGPPKGLTEHLPPATQATLESYHALICLGALHASDDDKNGKPFTADEFIAGVKEYCPDDPEWETIEKDLRTILSFFEIIKKVGVGFRLR